MFKIAFTEKVEFMVSKSSKRPKSEEMKQLVANAKSQDDSVSVP